MSERGSAAGRRLETRITGRVVAAIGLAVSSPLLLVCALAVKSSSPGTVIFKAPRVGKDGRTFTIWKLRTMEASTTTGATRITGGRDARVFPVGRLLRKLKLDELPQVVNIIRGDMAIVGPRPEDPTIVEEHYTPVMRETLDVLPGLTSPGSLDYYARETSMPDDPAKAEAAYFEDLLPRKIALDLVYVRNRSWVYDLELVARTALAMLGLPGLYSGREAWELTHASAILCKVMPEWSPGDKVDE